MKKMILMVLMLGIMALATTNAHAIVVADIDGFDNGEWVFPILSSTDVNEGDINDKYDIWKIAMIVENNGDTNDGLYIGWLMYDAPTFDAYPSVGSNRPSYRTILDLNMNGIEDGNDRRIDYAWIAGVPTLSVYDGSLNPVAGVTTSAIQTVGANAGVEWFIPESMFASFPLSGFQSFSILDNGGLPGEDYNPNSGWSTSVPEPSSMLLLGIGLVGFVGRKLRRFKA